MNIMGTLHEGSVEYTVKHSKNQDTFADPICARM